MNIKIFRFSIPFRSNLIINNIDLENRQGIIVSVSCMGQTGFGEASPLESFSKETLSDVLWALEGLIVAVDNCSIGEARELAKLHLSSAPSAAFAFDTALYDLEAKINNKALRYFINAEALEYISVNALIDEDLSLSNKTFKVKLSEKNIFSLVEKIEVMCGKIKNDSKLRIDFNGGLDLARSIRLVKEIKHLKDKIEYIEQPLFNDQFCIEDTSELRLHSDIPIALDETASSFESIQKIVNYNAADAVIIKPMQCGFFSEIFSIKRLLDDSGIKIIFSSMYDGPVAFQASLNLASALQIDSCCGYDTIKLFKDKNLFAVKINNGLIEMNSDIGLGIDLNYIKEYVFHD